VRPLPQEQEQWQEQEQEQPHVVVDWHWAVLLWVLVLADAAVTVLGDVSALVALVVLVVVPVLVQAPLCVAAAHVWLVAAPVVYSTREAAAGPSASFAGTLVAFGVALCALPARGVTAQLL